MKKINSELPNFIIEKGEVDTNFELDGSENDKELLELSIEKWQTIVDHIKSHIGKSRMVKDGGKWTCTCCLRYFENHCYACPIYEYKSRTHCEETPYALYQDKPNLTNAKKEVAFLKKVLESLE